MLGSILYKNSLQNEIPINSENLVNVVQEILPLFDSSSKTLAIAAANKYSFLVNGTSNR